MSFPTISAADARRFLTALRNNEEPLDPSVRTPMLGPERDWDEIAETIKEALAPLRDSAGDEISRLARVAARFEALAAVEIHKLIPRHHPALGDPTFWTWLAITHFRDLIGWRYGNDQNGSHPENYGIGKRGTENLLYRLWMRAEIAYDPGAEDPYHLARLGNIDFWRSHVLRQGYSNGRQFARALARFQFPGGPEDKPRLDTEDIRKLAKRLKAARTNLIVEIMDRDRATEFIRGEWSKLAPPAVGVEATA
jgi:Family of unknown function (DUF6339)